MGIRKTDPPVEIKISLPTSLVGKMEMRLFDPVRAKARYGARSKLIEELLRAWLREQEQADSLQQ